jgi:serine/threonine-protein kinase OSR1/STK39
LFKTLNNPNDMMPNGGLVTGGMGTVTGGEGATATTTATVAAMRSISINANVHSSNDPTLTAAPLAWPVDYNSYKTLGKVGQGAFASVWRAECIVGNDDNGDETNVGGRFGNDNGNANSSNNGNVVGTCIEGGRAMAQETSGNLNSSQEGGGKLVNNNSSRNDGQNVNEGTGTNTGKRLCAIKILDLEHVDTNFGDIRLEVQTMRLSSHPNILSIHTSFIQSSNLWLVMQLMNKGSSLHCLQSIRSKLKYQKYNRNDHNKNNNINASNVFNETMTTSTNSKNDQNEMKKEVIQMEDHITYILHETLLGLKYIHDNGQIHRDIKAGNILLDSEGNVRIADFGVSGWLVHGGSKRENTRTFVGTPCWMAPEVMEQIHGYDTKADIWSLGITALELAKGYAPYAKYPPMKVLLLTIQEDPPSLDTYLDDDDNYDSSSDEDNENDVIMNEEWSQSFQSMIKLCLQKIPKQRPNCEELLQHEHFQPLSDLNVRNEYQSRIKAQICDQIDNVGTSSKDAADGGKKKGYNSRKTPTCVIPSTESVPAGTTWIFTDGSQVKSSNTAASEDDNQDFLTKFEQTTKGEHFKHPSKVSENDTEKKELNNDVEDKDDMCSYLDELEKITTGENFKNDAGNEK